MRLRRKLWDAGGRGQRIEDASGRKTFRNAGHPKYAEDGQQRPDCQGAFILSLRAVQILLPLLLSRKKSGTTTVAFRADSHIG